MMENFETFRGNGPAESSIQAKEKATVSIVSAALVDPMRHIRALNNSIPLMEQFGISYNSWRKLQSGEPVRRSIAKRLVARLADAYGLECPRP